MKFNDITGSAVVRSVTPYVVSATFRIIKYIALSRLEENGGHNNSYMMLSHITERKVNLV